MTRHPRHWYVRRQRHESVTHSTFVNVVVTAVIAVLVASVVLTAAVLWP
jgi:hypothetical protein